MNNKGFSVAELIITFVIVMTISLGLFTTVDSYRETQQNQSYKKMIDSYMNEILIKIQDDVHENGGFSEIDGLNTLDTTDGKCTGYDQGILITYKSGITRRLCIGNGTTSSDKNGVLYGDTFFDKPTKFLRFSNDFLYSKIEVDQKQFFKITIKAKHSELKEIFEIDIVSP